MLKFSIVVGNVLVLLCFLRPVGCGFCRRGGAARANCGVQEAVVRICLDSGPDSGPDSGLGSGLAAGLQRVFAGSSPRWGLPLSTIVV